MLSVKNLTKSFGKRTLFENACFQINPGDAIAVIGPNGSGKSTLLKTILGAQEIDDGSINLKSFTTIGYLEQETAPLTDAQILPWTGRNIPDFSPTKQAQAKKILSGLGFKEADFNKNINQLSGGWAMRVEMARLLLEAPDILMLDEPTNHLDLMTVLWLGDYLQHYKGALIIISHDRDFLNKTCKKVFSLEHGKIESYNGNYAYFEEESVRRKERLEKAYKDQQREIEQMEEFIAKNRARATTASRAQSVIKKLEKVERIELIAEEKEVHIVFPQPRKSVRKALQLCGVGKAYGDLQVYKDIDFILERGEKIAFVGDNGAGKSTLLKILAGVIEPDEGKRIVGNGVKVGYFSQHRSQMLDPEKTVLEEALECADFNAGETLIRTILGAFLFRGDDVYKKTAVLSGGEKSRLALCKILLNPPNVLLLDEPTTHLDIKSVNALIAALKDFDGTICAISHDVYFLNSVMNHTIHIKSGRLSVYPGNFEYFLSRQQAIAEEEAQELAVKREENEKKNPLKHGAQDRRLKAKLNLILKELNAAEEERAQLTEKLTDPQTYKDFDKLTEINGRIKTLNEFIAKQEQLYLETDGEAD